MALLWILPGQRSAGMKKARVHHRACSGDAILMQSSNSNTIIVTHGTDATGTIKMGNHSGAVVRINDGNGTSVGDSSGPR